MQESRALVPCRLCHGTHARLHIEKEGYSILQCADCGLIYLDDAPQAQVLQSLYSSPYFQGGRRGYHDYRALESSLTATRNARLRRMAKLSRPGRLLEIGCAMGFFMRAAQQMGWKVQGVELSEYAAAVARDQFGLPVITGTLEDGLFPDESFDAVVLWDVIEHVPDPAELMRRVASLLKPGGLVGLSTGDVDSLLARLTGPSWHLYNLPEHLSFFSPATMQSLLQTAGLRVRRLDHAGARYTCEYLAYRLKIVYPSALTSRLFHACQGTRAGGWGIWVNLFDIMTVLAVKERPAA